MIVTIKRNAEEKEIQELIAWLESFGLQVRTWVGAKYTLIGLIGDTASLDGRLIESMPIVEKITRIQEPYKNATRQLHPESSVINVGGVKIGGGHFAIMAGPCSVESREQVIEIAKRVSQSGAAILRGGAFKPRSSPYSFQGMGADGLELLLEAKRATGLPIVSEVMDVSQLPLFEDVDMLQIGARNMQNFTLLKAVGKLRKPVLLKRGLCATYEEWLMAAEYIMSEGNENVILCERGIRTFETYTRNTLDVSAIPAVKRLSHLPVVVDPSHAAGLWWMVEPLAKAAVAVGADGLLIEVHNNPEAALCDGAQSLRPERFARLMGELKGIARIVGRDM